MDRLDLNHELLPIRQIIDSPVGDTTFGDFIRVSRNKLTTHGNLSVESLPEREKSVPYDPVAADRFEELMEEFVYEVSQLRSRLEGRPRSDTM